jgi:MFS family permease
VLAVAMMLFFYGLFGWLVHQVPFYESIGLSTGTASVLVAIYAGFGMIARLTFGFVADSVRVMELAAMTLAGLMLAAMTTLFISTEPAAIGLFLVFYVLGAGGAPMMEALLLTRAFGVAHFATIFGVFFMVETLGQVISPVVAGAIFDSQGSYDLVILMWMGTFATSMVLLLIAAKLPRPWGNPAP